jgi:hypothetical protein
LGGAQHGPTGIVSPKPNDSADELVSFGDNDPGIGILRDASGAGEPGRRRA